MCQPVALRLRGTFIDFDPCQSAQDSFGHGSRRRTFSCPPEFRMLEEPAQAMQDSEKQYLKDLISRVTELSAKDHKADDTKFKGLEKHFGKKTAEYEANQKESAKERVRLSDIIKVSSFANQPESLQATNHQLCRSARHSHSHTGMDTTTLMIRNIPCKLKLKDMVDLLNKFGFADKYDFLHLPGRGNQFSNLGYAFINFCSSAFVPAFVAIFNGVAFSRLLGINTDKVIDIRPARAQGFAENMAKVGHVNAQSDDVSLFWKQA